MRVTAPQSPAEWAAYYQLRYQVLRAPWQQPPGSEHAPDDEDPATCHAAALAEDGTLVGVGRLHAATAAQGQVRFMAVHPAWQGQGVGQAVLTYLEAEARRRGLTECVLHARAAAVPFYERAGYAVVAPSHTLFGSIPHFLMQKPL
ncbi:GNAT family N-acetyltransferase [Hymenobacter sp. BT18]|uniref:GNAT family N-acetyltransferase n=1 Tax=Hymenobacter sp. BT18 TaxID=2835648 RepID=UPI00143E697E|nr:GNAT family N-acetyltransferase [Hymenobacter sp. BT18]QIX61922.1 GNAT family N-acetyltransferase [Hymenobacter sp. BT18]